jgi:membrane associated rhomboid family serine protease
MRKPFTTIAAILFALIAVLHVVRIVFAWEITISDARVPMWASVVGAIIAAVLAVMVKREVRV